MTNYPDCYLHVEHCQSGETYIMPLRGNSVLCLKTQIKNWLKKEFNGEIVLDGGIMPRLSGEYYAKIMTDGRPPDSVVCWQSGGFYTKISY